MAARRRPFTVITVTLGVAALLATGIGAVYLTRPGEPTAPTRQASPDQVEPEVPPVPGHRGPARPVKPLNPGWTAIWSNTNRLAYDIPPKWQVAPPRRVPGFASPDGRVQVPVFGTGMFGADYCRRPGLPPAGWRAVTALTVTKEADTGAAAEAMSRKLAASAFTLKDAPASGTEVAAPVPFEANGLKGTRVTTRVTLPPGQECDPPAGRIDVVTVDMGGAQAVFLLLADQGVADAATDEDIEGVIKTLRSSDTTDA